MRHQNPKIRAHNFLLGGAADGEDAVVGGAALRGRGRGRRRGGGDDAVVGGAALRGRGRGRRRGGGEDAVSGGAAATTRLLVGRSYGGDARGFCLRRGGAPPRGGGDGWRRGNCGRGRRGVNEGARCERGEHRRASPVRVVAGAEPRRRERVPPLGPLELLAPVARPAGAEDGRRIRPRRPCPSLPPRAAGRNGATTAGRPPIPRRRDAGPRRGPRRSRGRRRSRAAAAATISRRASLGGGCGNDRSFAPSFSPRNRSAIEAHDGRRPCFGGGGGDGLPSSSPRDRGVRRPSAMLRRWRPDAAPPERGNGSGRRAHE